MKIVTKLGSAKANAVLITKLLLTLKARPGADNDDFFVYENQPKPPSLYDHWKLMYLHFKFLVVFRAFLNLGTALYRQ